MNILLIDKGGYFLDFALRCLDAGHDVRWFLGAMKGGFRNPQGDGLGVKKVPAWEPSMRWADIILIPDNSVYMEQLEVWRRRGFPIWGPNCETAEWELCRRKGQEIISSIGAKTIPSYTFGRIDDAIRFLKANPRRYVSKLDDDNDTKAMSYVAKSPRDLLFMLEKWKRQHAMKVDFVLQDFVPGVEMAVGGWFGPAGFSEWWCENWEHKKLMSGEIGPNCYSEDTEVLTRRGWLRFDSVTMEDEIASFQPRDGSMFFERPTAIHWTDYSGQMYHFENRYVDLLVTPTHQMWVARRKTDRWGFYDAQYCPSEFDVQQTARSVEKDLDFVTIPAAFGYREMAFSADDWFRFMGLYLSEGYVDERGRIHICQTVGAKKDIMRDSLRRLGIAFSEYDVKFTLEKSAISLYLSEFGRSSEKFVPDYIKSASARQIDLFLEAFCLGDGDWHYGHRRYHSGSYRMIGDIQELLLRIGKVGIISVDKRTVMTSPLNGKVYEARPVYSIEESTRTKASIRDKRVVDYSGKIGCVTLPSTHLLFVRRSGRVAISGNTGEMGTVLRYTEDSPLAERLLRPLEGQLYRAGFTGYIDVAVIVGRNGTPYPLEFTTRPGWPLFEIQQAVHPEPVEWMKNALDGRWTFKPLPDVVTGVVVALPDFPYCSWPHEKKVGYPLYGADRISRRHFHPTQVMMGEAPNADLRPEPILVSAGDCVATITGYGDSVCEASEAAYANVKKLELPNSPLYRDDIGEKLKDILPRLKEHDLVRGVKYD